MGPPTSFRSSAARVAAVGGAKPRDWRREAACRHSPLCNLRCTSFASARPSSPQGVGALPRRDARRCASRWAVEARCSQRPARAKAIRPNTKSRLAASRSAGGVCFGRPPEGAQRTHRERLWVAAHKRASSSEPAGQAQSSSAKSAKRSPRAGVAPFGTVRRVGSGVRRAPGELASCVSRSPPSHSGKQRGPGAELPQLPSAQPPSVQLLPGPAAAAVPLAGGGCGEDLGEKPGPWPPSPKAAKPPSTAPTQCQRRGAVGARAGPPCCAAGRSGWCSGSPPRWWSPRRASAASPPSGPAGCRAAAELAGGTRPAGAPSPGPAEEAPACWGAAPAGGREEAAAEVGEEEEEEEEEEGEEEEAAGEEEEEVAPARAPRSFAAAAAAAWPARPLAPARGRPSRARPVRAQPGSSECLVPWVPVGSPACVLVQRWQLRSLGSTSLRSAALTRKPRVSGAPAAVAGELGPVRPPSGFSLPPPAKPPAFPVAPGASGFLAAAASAARPQSQFPPESEAAPALARASAACSSV